MLESTVNNCHYHNGNVTTTVRVEINSRALVCAVEIMCQCSYLCFIGKGYLVISEVLQSTKLKLFRLCFRLFVQIPGEIWCKNFVMASLDKS